MAEQLSGKSEKVYPGDPVGEVGVFQGSSTDLTHVPTSSLDLVITDPPFGGLLHYSELSDFFYVWLRLALKDKYYGQRCQRQQPVRPRNQVHGAPPMHCWYSACRRVTSPPHSRALAGSAQSLPWKKRQRSSSEHAPA